MRVRHIGRRSRSCRISPRWPGRSFCRFRVPAGRFGASRRVAERVRRRRHENPVRRHGPRIRACRARPELRGDELSFFFLFEEEIPPATIRAVGSAGGCPTMNWFADDHWRFDGFTRHYAPAFDWSITTDRDSLPKYEAIGYERAILSQWACNRY